MEITDEGVAAARAIHICDFCILVALTGLLVFTPLVYGAIQPRAVALFECVAGLAGFLYLCQTLWSGRFSHLRTPADLLFFLIAGYASLQLIGPLKSIGLCSIYPEATKSELLRVISYGLIFFLTLNTVKTRRRITRLAAIIIAVGFLMSLLYFIRYLGFRAPRGFINRDHLSAYLAMIVPLAFGFIPIPYRSVLFPGRPGTSKRHPEQRLLIFFCVLVMSAGLFFTLSRGGMLSLAGAFIVMVVLSRTKTPGRYWRWLLPSAVAGIILLIIWIGWSSVTERIGTIEEEVLSGRLAGRTALWRATVGIIGDFPVFGTGLGTFKYNYISPRVDGFGINPVRWTHAHSDFLELLSETGIPFFLLLTVAALYLFFYLLRHFRAGSDPWTLALSVGLFGSLTSIFIHSFIDFSLRIPANSILLAVELALLIRLMNMGHQVGKFRLMEYIIPRTANIILCPLGIILLGGFIFVSIKPALADYYYRRTLKNSAGSAESLKKAINLEPDNAFYHYKLGVVYQREDLKRALSEYRKAVELDPRNGKYRQSLAWTYGRLADRLYGELKKPNQVKDYYRKAIDEFEDAVCLDLRNPYRHRAYAIWLFEHPTKENVKKGAAEYRKAITLEPTLAEEGIKRYYKLQRDFEKLYRILPRTMESDARFFEFLLEKKGVKFAVDFAEKHLKTYPGNERVNYLIIKESSPGKEFPWEFKKKRYNVLFEIAPLNPSYRERYGAELARRGEYEEAIANFETAVKLNRNPETKRLLRNRIKECGEKLSPAGVGADENTKP